MIKILLVASIIYKIKSVFIKISSAFIDGTIIKTTQSSHTRIKTYLTKENSNGASITIPDLKLRYRIIVNGSRMEDKTDVWTIERKQKSWE